jgi:cytoskeletal protein RodZ
MNITGVLSKLVAPGVVFALLINSFAYGQQPSASPAAPESTQSTPSQSTDNAAGTVQDSGQQGDQELPDTPSSSQSPSATQSPNPTPQGAQQQPDTQAMQAPPQNAPHEPLGTAAAPNIPTSGIAASRPAGAALAPAKQRRVRSILIKMGAIAGIGVAVGATLALTKGSPSTPPGAR